MLNKSIGPLFIVLFILKLNLLEKSAHVQKTAENQYFSI